MGMFSKFTLNKVKKWSCRCSLESFDNSTCLDYFIFCDKKKRLFYIFEHLEEMLLTREGRRE